MVRVVGVEPTRLSAQEPKGDVTLVKEKLRQFRLGFFRKFITKLEITPSELLF